MDNEFISANALLKSTGITLLDAARLVKNILDTLPQGSYPLQRNAACGRLLPLFANKTLLAPRFNKGYPLSRETSDKVKS